jgi:metal-responsive CopG/Arc/MetJ family transcriptional regulator
MTTLSLKVPKKLEARLTTAARRRGTTKSALVREALDRFLSGDENKPNKAAVSCMDLASDLAGCISGPKDLATNKRYMRGFGR